MKRIPTRSGLCCLLVMSFLWVGCSTPNLQQRIAKDQEVFDQWPEEAQTTVESGKIAIGFTREQVRMAWGDPSHIGMETTETGRFERWIYEKSSPGFGISVGGGSFGRSSSVGGSVGTTIGGRTDILAIVRLQDGIVVSFEKAK